jgi:hypothetical protein
MKAKLISGCGEEVMGKKPKTRAAAIVKVCGRGDAYACFDRRF